MLIRQFPFCNLCYRHVYMSTGWGRKGKTVYQLSKREREKCQSLYQKERKKKKKFSGLRNNGWRNMGKPKHAKQVLSTVRAARSSSRTS